jgi:hypothetical protein
LRLFSHNAANLFSLVETDHGTGSSRSLRDQVDDILTVEGMGAVTGKVFLFCMPATFGYSFNPLSLYFCHDTVGNLVAVIYQVHNTFGGRHNYVQTLGLSASTLRHECAKDFYVSPFLEMGLHYKFKVTPPGETVGVGIRVEENGLPVLDAVLTGKTLPLSDFQLLRLAFAIPAISFKVMTAILWEATCLRLKGLKPRFPDGKDPVISSP